jgi:hypothetical protein
MSVFIGAGGVHPCFDSNDDASRSMLILASTA